MRSCKPPLLGQRSTRKVLDQVLDYGIYRSLLGVMLKLGVQLAMIVRLIPFFGLPIAHARRVRHYWRRLTLSQSSRKTKGLAHSDIVQDFI